MFTKNFLICLAGLPASGKSTFARKLKEIIEQEQKNYKSVIIDPDKIRQALFPHGFDHHEEPIVRKKNLEQIKSALNAGQIVISDDLNYYTSMRHDLKEIADKLKLEMFIIHIETPLNTCLRWNMDRGHPIPNDLIRKINDKFDKFDKYSWDFPIARFDLSKIKNLDSSVEKLLKKINRELKSSREHDEKKSALRDELTLRNEMIDKITRNIVGKLLEDPRNTDFKNDIIKHRKKFVKKNLNKSMDELLIAKNFKKYLKESLGHEFS
ncbi:MAG: adenylyl-sulfate kinase [Promethearchaeota archaeon]|nr:MAG: adenylyl-sulfate kinase [Candidatus Lokiarchaeota archaeon]